MSDLALVLEQIEGLQAFFSTAIYQLKKMGDVAGLEKVAKVLESALADVIREVPQIDARY